MTPGKFLRLVWPSQGFYCIAHPFRPEGSAVTLYAHKVFATISEAVTHVHEQEHQQDTFFAVLSLAAEKVWDPAKKDHKTGQLGAWSVRKQENMLASKTSFWDLDVGAEAGKYPTQVDALKALIVFCQTTQLPLPTLVSSGGGVHVYWHYDAEVPAAQCREIQWNLRQLGDALGMRYDPTRTIDMSSVLRVPGTFNWKNRDNPRRVQVLQEGAITPPAVFHRAVLDALIRAGGLPTPAPVRAAPTVDTGPLGSNIHFNDFPKSTLAELGAACGQVREIVRSQTDASSLHFGPLDNTAWYRGMLATVKHVEDGDNWCRKLTALHPRSVSDIEAKLVQLEGYAPAKCETLQQFMPWKDAPCQGCRFRDKVPNPHMAARLSTSAPPPSAQAPTASPGLGPPLSPSPATGSPGTPKTTTAPLLPSPAVIAAINSSPIPNPPKPFERLKAGGIAITKKDKDGNETTSVIYANDLFPLRRLTNSEEVQEQHVWRVVLPRTGAKDFVLDADVLYDARKFCAAIAHNGIFPHKADIPALQDYMTAYIAQLQKDNDATDQATHLGWAGEYEQFILPDKILLADGSIRAASLSTAAERATQHVTKKGDLAEQIKLMYFYNHERYIPNQSVILDAFASVIFYATGHHGIVVNCSGDAGASKSTTLYTAAGVWGDPQLWPINGTNRGATANGRAQRILTNANLPTCVDEITNIPPREAIDMVMNITQPGHRIRLQTDGTERATPTNYKSAIMVATANSSLHSLLSTDNAAGTAGSMRVFEMRFAMQNVHTKAEADEYMRQVKLHYGHLGEIFVRFVIQHRVAVEHRVHAVMREIDTEANISSAERFWSARIATGIVAGEICKALGLLPYDVTAIRRWSVTRQVPYMRGVVKEEYRDALGILTDYIAEKHGNIVTIERTGALGANIGGNVGADSAYALNNPHGALVGHYDLRSGMLFLLKQPFKDYCTKVGTSSGRVLEELHQPRANPGGVGDKIVTDKQTRRTLGAGTNLARGQSWCFAVNMDHPEISGKVQLVQGGAQVPTAPAGNLRSVS